MNYRLRYWHELFEGLINIHLINGNHFDSVIHNGLGKEAITLERLDYDRDNETDFLRYTFEDSVGNKVVYSVDNKPEGGLDIKLVRVVGANDEVLQLDTPNHYAQRTMNDCYMAAVKLMNTFWYD